jgi:GNAT superfamily N-acetyltransferase
VSDPAGAQLDLELVARLEAHSVLAWPPTVCERQQSGWLLRATPGLDRGRSNNALTPCRQLSARELCEAVERVEAFASRHGIRPGIQVSPLELHDHVVGTLAELGWRTEMSVRVLSAPVPEVARGGAALELIVSDFASDEWLAAWALCESRQDLEAHASTVFARLRGRARFVRDREQRAVGISVESGGLVGLFCLAVAPSARRGGLGTALVRGILARCTAPSVYLQVEAANAAALALYERLGFTLAYTYCHCVAPDP